MLKIKTPDASDSFSQFEYDAMGRRLIYTDDDGNKTLYYYDGIRVILEKKKPSGSPTWTTSQVYTLQGGSIGFIISFRDAATGNDTWYHYDRLGTVMNLTDDVGAITATYDQDAFGNVLSGSANGFHLTTKDYNSVIGLYYFYMRWYDPKLGRFILKDYYHVLNRYIYCRNRPLSYVDIDGMWGRETHDDLTFYICIKSAAHFGIPANKRQQVCGCMADANQGMDDNRATTADPLRLRYHPKYHFPLQDEFCTIKSSFKNNAFEHCSCQARGQYLHMLQDATAHFPHKWWHILIPGVDNPAKRPEGWDFTSLKTDGASNDFFKKCAYKWK